MTRFWITGYGFKTGSFSRLMIIIKPNTKISQYSIKLELKELYKNVALFSFFLFTCTEKEGGTLEQIDLSKGTSNDLTIISLERGWGGLFLQRGKTLVL